MLLEARERRASGVLEMAHGGGTSRLWFHDGAPVGAQVFVGFRPLGHMLLQAGLIDIDALSRSLVRMAETRRPHGEILVEMGARRATRSSAAAGGAAGGVRRPARRAARGPVRVRAERRGAGAGHARGSSRRSRVLADALAAPAAADLVGSALGRVEAGAVKLAAGYAREGGGARRRRSGGSSRGSTAPRSLDAYLGAAERAAGARPGAARGAAPPRRRAVPADAGERDGIVSPRALELACAASPDRARGARAVARQGAQSDPAEARARRQRLLQRAMRNMGVGPFGARPAVARRAPTRTPTPGETPPNRRGRRARGGDDALREALLAVAPRAQERDLFARLGLSDGAGRDEVKSAFLALARQFHPDRFASPANADLADTVRDLFAAVNEAYEVLSDDRKRARRTSPRAPASPPRAAGASADFRRARRASARATSRGRGGSTRRRSARIRARRTRPPSRSSYLADPRARIAIAARRLLAEATRTRPAIAPSTSPASSRATRATTRARSGSSAPRSARTRATWTRSGSSRIEGRRTDRRR